ncbi:zinc finger BED domain-containing protein RICESLEEPER 2-like [Iris pallida]|uniref:Zinc finger BED domain-containing protein RICESLEEPER 2-like n=1 Tax=Iris pallida TaxID=29817 RepID=A0AAX6F512_IRIPA|nr:zinc finger BED domain-containing protein RICESLEEPER 2-like [Iris pallida]
MSEITDMDVSTSNAANMSGGGNPKTARRLRSLVWNDFTKERRPDGNCIAICNHCKKQLTASSRAGTTHLKNHLITCTSTKVRVKRKKLVVRRLGKDFGNDNVEGPNFDQEKCRHDLAQMVVYHGYPFTIVRHAGFRTFVKNLQPQFKLMTDDMIRADCMKIYEDGRVKLRELLEKLPCRVSLTVEMWRSRDDAPEDYMCLACHYVDDDWKLKRKILNFLHVGGLTSVEEISKIIVEKLHDWNIYRKLFSIVLDNCSDSLVVAELPNYVRPKGFLPLRGDLFIVQGAASFLNIIAQHFMMFANDIISRVRDSVQYVRSSLDTLNGFQKHVERVGAPEKELVLDDSHDLSLTYLMLETACEFQGAFTCFAEEDDGCMKLSPDDWTVVRAVTDCLYVFYQAIAKFSGARIPTANLYFNEICDIHLQLVNWGTSSVPEVAAIASQTLETFEQYWSTTRLVMIIASILDPRYKMKSIEYFFKQIYGDTCETTEKIESIRKCLGDLYNEYVAHSNNLSGTQKFLCYSEYSHSSDSATGNIEWRSGAESKSSSTFSDARRGLDHYLLETSSSQAHKSDLDLYLDEAVDRVNSIDDNFNILAWWKFYAAKYPVLSAMARDILAIPTSNSWLDCRSRLLDENLSSMDPVTVQGLKCGQDWLKDEFEGHLEPTAQVHGVITVPVTANLDGVVDKCTIHTTGDEFFLLSH